MSSLIEEHEFQKVFGGGGGPRADAESANRPPSRHGAEGLKPNAPVASTHTHTNTPGRVPAGDFDGVRPQPASERNVDDEFPDVTDQRDPDLPDGWQAPEDADTGF